MLEASNNCKGMSLIELLLGIALMGILTTFAVPSYKAWVQNSKIRNSASSIQNGLQLARAEAIKRNQRVQLELRGVNSAWTVCVSPSPAGNCPNPDDSSTIQSRATGDGGSSSITVNTTLAGPYVFDGLGTLRSPSPAANTLIRITVDINPSVLPAADSRDLQIIMGAGGNSRLCDPNLSSSGTDPRRCP
ncbi:MAG: GspH/FimT family pseudopilin [Methylotenera sp.]|nr:GspH/FimT family pseudopilin [Methylotenera sp.]